MAEAKDRETTNETTDDAEGNIIPVVYVLPKGATLQYGWNGYEFYMLANETMVAIDSELL